MTPLTFTLTFIQSNKKSPARPNHKRKFEIFTAKSVFIHFLKKSHKKKTNLFRKKSDFSKKNKQRKRKFSDVGTRGAGTSNCAFWKGYWKKAFCLVDDLGEGLVLVFIHCQNRTLVKFTEDDRTVFGFTRVTVCVNLTAFRIHWKVKAGSDRECIGCCPFSQGLFMMLWLKGSVFNVTTVDKDRWVSLTLGTTIIHNQKLGKRFLIEYFSKPKELADIAPGTSTPFILFDNEVVTDPPKIVEFLEAQLQPPKWVTNKVAFIVYLKV